jgi:hypothetical protein
VLYEWKDSFTSFTCVSNKTCFQSWEGSIGCILYKLVSCEEAHLKLCLWAKTTLSAFQCLSVYAEQTLLGKHML